MSQGRVGRAFFVRRAARLLRTTPVSKGWPLVALAFSTGGSLSACGSRSTLLASDGPSASGGQGGSGQAGSGQAGSGQAGSGQAGSTSGGAGGQGPCNSLALVEPLLATTAGADVEFEEALRLTASSDDGLRVTGVFLRQAKGSSSPVVHHTTLSPWKSWPADGNLPVHSTKIIAQDSPMPSLSPGGHFNFATLSNEGVSLFPALDPDVSGQDASAADIALPGNDATFVAPRGAWQDGPTHLAGTFDSQLGQIGTLLREDGTVSSTVSFGCSSIQLSSAAAVPFQDGWIVAVSSGSPVAPGCSPQTPDLPTRVDLLRVSPDGSMAVLASVPSEVVIDVGITPHPAGAYVVWLQSKTGVSVLRGARVDGTTGALVGPVDLTPPGEQAKGFVVGSVGPLLGLARHHEVPGGASDLLVAVLDEALDVTAETTFSPSSTTVGLSSAIGAPNGQGLLVAWTSFYPAPSRVHLARFDCSE